MKLKINPKIICITLALFTVLAFSTANYRITDEAALEVISTNNPIIMNIVKLGLNYEKAYGVNSCILFFLVTYFYRQISKMQDKTDKRMNAITLIGGLIFAFCMVFGNSFLHGNDWNLIFEGKFQMFISLINYIGYVVLFRNLLRFLLIKIKRENNKLVTNSEKKHNKFGYCISTIERNHPILFYTVGFLICWLIYVIIFYPDPMNMDSLSQIEQYFGATTMTTHHPIFATIIYGIFMKIGSVYLQNDNLGLFLNNIFQVFLAAFVLSYSIHYLYQLTKSKKIKYALFLFFAFFPIWPLYFYTEVKDVYFSIAILLYSIFSIKFIVLNGKMSKKEWFLYGIAIALVYLFRNNGIHILLISLPFLAIVVKKTERIKIILCTILILILCSTSMQIYSKVNNVQKGSVREVLAIPLQQTARYVREYELTEKEEQVISKLIGIEDMKKGYRDETVDFVKEKYKGTATTEDLKEYFKIWFQMFCKHPSVYIKATLNATYGYYYPNRMEYKDGIVLLKIDAPDVCNVSNFAIHFLEHTEDSRNLIERSIYTLRNMPGIGLLFSCGLYTWGVIVVTLLLWYFKRKREMAILVPLYVIILVCIASPVNALVRYMLPIMLVLPFVIGWVTSYIHSNDTSDY